MAIEVRQLVIKSYVGEETTHVPDPSTGSDGESGEAVTDKKQAHESTDECFDSEAFRRQILSECRHMFIELINEQKER